LALTILQAATAWAGTIHIALGRNNDMGGRTWSRIHADGLMDKPTVELDGEVVVNSGILV